MAAFFITQEQFNLFHKIDRQLYTNLVIDLWRDPVESIQVMALCLWLERVGYGYVVKKILSLPLTLIYELADETVICFDCITKDHFVSPSESADIPLIQALLQKDISLQFFHDNRLAAGQGIAKIVNDVCIRALADIIQHAVERNESQNLLDTQIMLSCFHPAIVLPGLLHQSEVGPSDVVLSWRLEKDVPADDRTMFITFSRGYPVREWEVEEFFTRAYGDCIESLYMQEVEPTEQSLFARIVFLLASTIGLILNGMEKAKFSINSKHVWARKFVPKCPSSTPAPLLPLGDPHHSP